MEWVYLANDLISVERGVLSHCSLLPANCRAAGLLPLTRRENKDGVYGGNSGVQFSFVWTCCQASLCDWGNETTGLPASWAGISSGSHFIEDFSSYHKALWAGAELISLCCPSPDVGMEVSVPRLDDLSLRRANWNQIGVALFLHKCIIIL